MSSESVKVESHLSVLKECWSLVDDAIENERNVLAKNQRNYELESKFAAELKLNSELRERLQEIEKSSNDLEKICSKFENLNIADRDQSRLNNVQEMLNIGKQYTGIRWDYSAPPNLAKGYVKNSSKMLLECFEYITEGAEGVAATERLWQHAASAAAVAWHDLVTAKTVDKENLKNN